MGENKPEESNAIDRRKSDRKKLIVDVHFEGGDGTGIANSSDISAGGLFLTTNAALNVGSQIFMRLTLGGKEITLVGSVAYKEIGRGFGVSFDSDSAEIEKLLAQDLN